MTEAPRLNLRDWAAAAEEVADPAAWEYLERGSGANLTRSENVAAWSRWVLLPHVLRDVSTVDLSTTVLDTRVSTPILVAPTAMHRFFTTDGELATARAAAAVGTVYVVSVWSQRPAHGAALRHRQVVPRSVGQQRPLDAGARVLDGARPLVDREPGRDLGLVVDELVARDVDDDLLDRAAGEPVRSGVLGRDR